MGESEDYKYIIVSCIMKLLKLSVVISNWKSTTTMCRAFKLTKFQRTGRLNIVFGKR